MSALSLASTPQACPDAARSSPGPHPQLQRIGRAAIAALYDELALYPKPGLVSFVDSGSHADMDATIFMRSLFALRRYGEQAAACGAAAAPFAALEQLGIEAERRMLRATGGVNTHRGAIFTLGLLCAAAGRLQGRIATLTPEALRESLRAGWGDALVLRRGRQSASNGQRAARRHGLRSAAAEAAEGFPVLFEVAVPALAAATRAGLGTAAARLQTLFSIIAVLDDTNLAHRGGAVGLRHARRTAKAFLEAGGAGRLDAFAAAEAIHRDFVSQRLSPGGSADLLAAACWMQRICG